MVRAGRCPSNSARSPAILAPMVNVRSAPLGITNGSSKITCPSLSRLSSAIRSPFSSRSTMLSYTVSSAMPVCTTVMLCTVMSAPTARSCMVVKGTRCAPGIAKLSLGCAGALISSVGGDRGPAYAAPAPQIPIIPSTINATDLLLFIGTGYSAIVHKSSTCN